MNTEYAGIDYGMGKTNVDTDTGIRYGVINQNEVLQAWADSSEPWYGEPNCPKCGNDAKAFETHSNQLKNGVSITVDIPEEMDSWERAKYDCEEYYCESCEYIFGSESAFEDKPHSFEYSGDGYQCSQSGDYGDIFILKSPYFTYSQFCSPCAPGAGYIMNPCENGPKTYCFGHDWFDDEKAPYPVYSVETGKLV